MLNAFQYVFQYLDYISRLSLNMALNKTDRIQTPLNHLVIKQVEILLNVSRLKKGIHNMESLRGIPRKDAFLNYFQNILPRNLLICQHNMKFRKAALEKIKIYMDPYSPEYENADDSLMDSLIPLCKNLEYTLNIKYFYLYTLELPNNDINWSPVDYRPITTIEAKPRKIVKKKRTF
jgi:hypothetical protein